MKMELVGCTISVPVPQSMYSDIGIVQQISWTDVSDLKLSPSLESDHRTSWLDQDMTESMEPSWGSRQENLISLRNPQQGEPNQRSIPISVKNEYELFAKHITESGVSSICHDDHMAAQKEAGFIFCDQTTGGDVRLMSTSISKDCLCGRRYKLQRAWNTKIIGVKRRFPKWSRQHHGGLKLDPFHPNSTVCYQP